MSNPLVFSSTGNSSYSFTCSSSASEAYTIPVGGPMVRITCEGTDDAFIVFGDSTNGLTCTIPTANSGGGTPTNPGARRLKAGAIEVFAVVGHAFATRCAATKTSTITLEFGQGT